MKNQIQLGLGKIDQRTVRLLLALGTLILLVLGASAPADAGGFGG